MKKSLRIICLLLAVMIMALMCVSCAQQKKYEEYARKYLKEKYPGRVFEMISYSRENEDTSSRYHVVGKCLSDSIEFDMYIYSSILITDSYSIDRANHIMKDLLKPIVEDSLVSENIEEITWIRKYKEGNTDGSFVEYNLKEKITLDDLNSLYNVKLYDTLSIDDVAKTILFLSRTLEFENKSLDSITYSFVYENQTYTLTLSTEVVKDMVAEKVSEYIVKLIENNKTGNKQFYWEETLPISLDN